MLKAKSKLVDAAMKAFVEGAADVPPKMDEAGERLLPQLWNKARPGNSAELLF